MNTRSAAVAEQHGLNSTLVLPQLFEHRVLRRPTGALMLASKLTPREPVITLEPAEPAASLHVESAKVEIKAKPLMSASTGVFTPSPQAEVSDAAACWDHLQALACSVLTELAAVVSSRYCLNQWWKRRRRSPWPPTALSHTSAPPRCPCLRHRTKTQCRCGEKSLAFFCRFQPIACLPCACQPR